MLGRLFEKLRGSASVSVRIEHSVALILCYAVVGVNVAAIYQMGF